MTHAQPQPGSVWVEQVVHATCQNCNGKLRRHPVWPGITGGITWYHEHTSYDRSNGAECPTKEAHP